jgi:dihydrofolate reductase
LGVAAVSGIVVREHIGEVLDMAMILVHEFMTLDGVYEDPSWTFDYPFDPKMGEAIAGIMGSCEAILLGRRTHQMFEPAWSPRTAKEDPGAPFMNESRKYVVSRTLKETTWNNSEIVEGYSADTVRALKEHHRGNLYVSGSGTLVRAMLADGLVDELHLFVFPLVAGRGGRLLEDGVPETRLALKSCEAYSNGAVYLVYERAR